MSHKADISFFDQKYPWSKYKDLILSYYLKPYLAKVARIGKPILLVDLFAGPGKFKDGSDGSPLILTNACIESGLSSEVATVLLNEQNDELFQSLQQNTAEHAAYTDLRHTDAIELLPEIAKLAQSRTVFLYVDPFSLSRLHLGKLAEVYKAISHGSSIELLFVFMAHTFLRWASACMSAQNRAQDVLYDKLVHREDGTFDPVMAEALGSASSIRDAKFYLSSRDELDAFAGGSYWRNYVSNRGEKPDHVGFVKHYCKILRTWFELVTRFPIYSSDSATIPKYWIIFASRYRPAIDLMNDAMYRARREEEKSWSEDSLFRGLELSPMQIVESVESRVLSVLQPSVQIRWRDLRHRVEEQSPGCYRRSEIDRCIKQLLKSGRLIGPEGKTVEDAEYVRLP